MRARVAALEGEIGDARQSSSAASGAEQANSELQRELAVARVELQQAELKATELEGAQAALAEQAATRAAELEAANATLQERLQSLAAELHSAEEEQRVAAARTATLEAELSGAQAAAEAAVDRGAELRGLARELDVSRARVEELERLAEVAQQRVVVAEADAQRAGDLAAELRGVQRELQFGRQRVEELEHELESAGDARSEAAALKEQVATLQRTREQLEAALVRAADGQPVSLEAAPPAGLADFLDRVNDALSVLRNSFRDVEAFVGNVGSGVQVLQAAGLSEAEMFKAIQKSLGRMEAGGTVEDVAETVARGLGAASSLKGDLRVLRDESGV